MVRLEGIEPPTNGLGNRCSILLSYRRTYRADSIVLEIPRGACHRLARTLPERPMLPDCDGAGLILQQRLWAAAAEQAGRS